MAHYLLRAEALRRQHARGRQRHRWHVARAGALFAVCTHRLGPATSVRPIEDAEGIPEDHRCPECWDRALAELMLPA
ncbi:hypothetical protein [Streptacidiphilus anmyonensis]|uniref:hypothetical protein n=1 Tax=Streptacidiphilus anmyonensis TaxID=405782 RepID=UPI0005A6C7B9|nr:hypothetical protein [Streptacidiphilus anmyonensis]